MTSGEAYRTVRLELWAGVGAHERKAFARAFGALLQLVPTEETWAPLPGWFQHAAKAGERFSLTDLLIASLATGVGGRVWSLDAAFVRMEHLRLVSRYDPPLA